jgi:hypothetical protein
MEDDPLDRREEEAYRRFLLIEDVVDPDLTDDERIALIAGLVNAGVGVGDSLTSASRATIYRYLKAYREGRLEALKPKKRKDVGVCRALPERILLRAISLRHILKERDTGRIIKRLEQLYPAYKGKIKRSTLDRHLAHANASRRQLGVVELKVYKRFEAPTSNDLWTGDVMHSCAEFRVVVPGQKSHHKIFLISWIDDYSRYITHSEWYLVERLPSLEDCFKKAVLAYGLPTRAYSDKGAIYEAKIWVAALADLDVHKVKTKPKSPAAHGKIEKWHQTARAFEQEAVAAGLNTLADVNAAWWAYLRVMYHEKVHDETGEKPSDRYSRFTDRRFPDPHLLSRLFLIREKRTVNRRFSTVPVRARDFRVDPMLRGRRVAVRFDPYALDRVYIWVKDREVQTAYPAVDDNLPAPSVPEDAPPEERTIEQREDSRAFLRGLREEAENLRKQELPGIHLAAMMDSSSLTYGWQAFTDHLGNALGRPFDEFTEAERDTAYQLWRDHGPLNRQWVQAALVRALASKGPRQHLAYYLDQIKLVHFDQDPDAGPSKSVAGARQGPENQGGTRV